MTDLNAMWEALVTHQPIANAKGYGAEWARMCELKTKEAAAAAAWAAYEAAAAGDADAAWAAADADAARASARAAWAAADAVAAAASKRAIEYITKANQEASHV